MLHGRTIYYVARADSETININYSRGEKQDSELQDKIGRYSVVSYSAPKLAAVYS